MQPQPQKQKHSPKVVLEKSCSEKFHKLYSKESLKSFPEYLQPLNLLRRAPIQVFLGAGGGDVNKSNSLINNIFLYKQNICGGMLLWRNSYILMVWIKWEQSWTAHDWLYSLNKDIEFKEATKSYFTHYSCVVIILFNTGLSRFAFSTIYYRTLLGFSSLIAFCGFCLEVNFLNQEIKMCFII